MTRRGLSALARAGVVLGLGLALSACAAWSWGQGLSEEDSGLPATSNGMVVAVADNGFAVASARLTGALRENFPDGIALLGSRLGEVPLVPEWGVEWTGVATVATAQLSATAAGPRISVTISGLQLAADAILPGVASCALALNADTATLTTGISITTAKSGALQASVLSDVTWATSGPVPDAANGAAPAPDVDDCLALFVGQTHVLDALSEELVTAAAQNVLSAMASTLVAVLPHLLGVGLGSRVTLSVDEGSAEATFEVKGPDGPSANPWSFADGRLFVFFSVASGGKRHECVPPTDPPMAAGLPVPALNDTSSATLMVNESALLRALHLVWAAGRVCGDRATRSVDFRIDDVAQAWPAMAALSASDITARVWPDGAFSAAFDDGPDDAAQLTLGTSSLRVELYATLDGARVLATAFTIGLSVTGPLVVADDGSVWLQSEGVAVSSATEVAGGIVKPPSNIASVLGDPLAQAILNNAPVWQLPSLPGASTTVQTRRAGGYLIFSHPSVEAPKATP